MTKPNCEAIAYENLVQQGYGCYFPKYRAVEKKRLLVKKPLFPRYVFALIDKFWYSIRGTRGVSHLLMGDNGPSSVPTSIIESLRAKEDKDGFIVLTAKQTVEKFNKGSTVRATQGPLTGLELIYDGMLPHERVRVLADLLGKQVPVIMEEKSLVAV